MELCEIIIYTANGAYSFMVKQTAQDFASVLSAALENGTVILDMTDGGKLIFGAINVVAIEVHEDVEENISPPP
ncbi:MAG: hypothetical protein LBL82_00235 [Oscillospiraceae bacterium]|nr:hypothetical protein [Oscillospiraceae bacterium]